MTRDISEQLDALAPFASQPLMMETVLVEGDDGRGAVIARPRGALDDGLDAYLDALAQPLTGTRGLVFDLGRLAGLSSQAMGALVIQAGRLEERGVPVLLCQLPEQAEAIVQMLGLRAFFRIEDTLRQALDRCLGLLRDSWLDAAPCAALVDRYLSSGAGQDLAVLADVLAESERPRLAEALAGRLVLGTGRLGWQLRYGPSPAGRRLVVDFALEETGA